MPNFNAVGEFARQAVEKLPERGKIARPNVAGSCSQYWPMREASGARRVKTRGLSRRSCAARPGAKWWPET
jgi:hypothetical protein